MIEFYEECKVCHGMGTVIRSENNIKNYYSCLNCNGTGTVKGILTYEDCAAVEVLKGFASKPKDDGVKDIVREAYLWADALAAERESRRGK